MSLIQGAIGHSLARIYDLAGEWRLRRLLPGEVAVVHDMGSTIFAESFRTGMRSLSSAAQTQGQIFAAEIGDLPDGVFRINRVFVYADATTRISNVTLNLTRGDSGLEIPIWSWDSASDIETTTRLFNGTSTADRVTLTPTQRHQVAQFPITAMNQSPNSPRIREANSAGSIWMRGNTSAFGAGTVTVTALFFLSLLVGQNSAEVGPYGIPFPSW